MSSCSSVDRQSGTGLGRPKAWCRWAGFRSCRRESHVLPIQVVSRIPCSCEPRSSVFFTAVQLPESSRSLAHGPFHLQRWRRPAESFTHHTTVPLLPSSYSLPRIPATPLRTGKATCISKRRSRGREPPGPSTPVSTRAAPFPQVF